MSTNGKLPALRTICPGKTENHFLVAAKSPFEVDDEGFEMLDLMAVGVHDLKEGSQVFVYDRSDFGATSYDQEEVLREYLDGVAEQVGSIAVYPTIRSLNQTPVPAS
jgi:hypothetical protein